MKPNKFLFVLLTFSILHTTSSIATVRYVSKTGSSKPPYTSWETAADSIQKAVNIADVGDTIYVANGTYNESIYIDKTINLWGSSADSTVIDGSGVPNNYIIYFYGNNSTFKNFKIISGQNKTGIANWKTNLKAENCSIINVHIPLSLYNSSPLIENFTIVNSTTYAVFEDCPADTCHGVYRNNIIISTGATETPISFGFGGYPTFINNILIEEGNIQSGIHGGFLRGILLKNNSVSGFIRLGISLGDIRTDTAYIINNNVTHIKNSIGAISIGTGHRTQIINNIITNTNIGVDGYHTNDSTKADYNLFWKVENLTGGNAILGDSNIVADPMFVNDTIPTSDMNYDFHLQKYSPAIDKGDQSITDVDGTRSDMGMYGGPGGEKYEYLDLAPRTPRNFTHSFDTTYNFLTLNWTMNTEYDFRNYKIFRDTVSGFTPGEFNLIAETDTSFFTDNLSNIKSSSVYYRVTAVDSQDNESQPGNEIAVTITTGLEPGVEIIRDYILYQNYPNPFNPSTIISYEIKERAYVKLMVYDIKGELVSVLVNKEQSAGYYEVVFNSQVSSPQSSVSKDLASGIYLYRIEVIGEGRIPVHSDMKKMLLIK